MADIIHLGIEDNATISKHKIRYNKKNSIAYTINCQTYSLPFLIDELKDMIQVNSAISLHQEVNQDNAMVNTKIVYTIIDDNNYGYVLDDNKNLKILLKDGELDNFFTLYKNKTAIEKVKNGKKVKETMEKSEITKMLLYGICTVNNLVIDSKGLGKNPIQKIDYKIGKELNFSDNVHQKYISSFNNFDTQSISFANISDNKLDTYNENKNIDLLRNIDISDKQNTVTAKFTELKESIKVTQTMSAVIKNEDTTPASKNKSNQ